MQAPPSGTGVYRTYAAASADCSRTVVVWVNENPESQILQDLTLQAQEKATCRALTR